MDYYHKYAGNKALFDNAPPRAEVVLEVIGEDRYIFAEAFKPGAVWWSWEGPRGRRGLVGGMMSDYYCAATRQPKAQFLELIRNNQADWDYRHGVSGSVNLHTQAPCPTCGITGIHACLGVPTKELSPEEEAELRKRLASLRQSGKGKTSMIKTQMTCMVCGKPTADGMIHTCTPSPRQDITQPAPYFPNVPVSVAPGDFQSIFEKDRFGPRPWVRINKSGRIKLCQMLMERFEGMMVDIGLDAAAGRMRIGEADCGKPLSARGFLHSKVFTRYIDFGTETNLIIFLDAGEDGWLYGKVPVKDAAHVRTALER